MSETMNIDISLARPQYERLVRMAAEQDRPVADLLSHLIDQLLTATEKEANYQKVQEARQKYPGQYVPIYQGRILANAADAVTLLQIVERDFGLTGIDVLLVKAETITELRVRHPQLTESL